MPPPPELEAYVEEAARLLGIPLEPQWRAAVAEHLSRLLEAWQLLEDSELE